MSKGYGFLYEPGNEREVCILFGLLIPYLSEEFQRLGFPSSEFYLDEFKESFPDCIFFVNKKKIRAEFELYSSNFKYHPFHDSKNCDLIICWKHDWTMDCPLPVLDLSKIISKIREKGLNLILEARPKNPDRGGKRWELEEFKDRLKEREILELINGLQTAESIRLQTGKGKKVATLGIGVDGLIYPLWIEDTGKAGIAYFNVDVKPPKRQLPEDKIREIRDFLSESKRKPKPRLWHYIEAQNTIELLNKLKKIIEIMLK